LAPCLRSRARPSGGLVGAQADQRPTPRADQNSYWHSRRRCAKRLVEGFFDISIRFLAGDAPQ
jgi:hypothetical protein